MIKMMSLSAMVAGAVMFGGSSKAEAANVDVHFTFGKPKYVPAPVVVREEICAPQVTRRWIPAHYETREERVLVSPERCEKVWVSPVTETRYDRRGRPYTVEVRPGYWREQHIPARYETRVTKVLIPGRWEETVADGCVTPPPPHHGHGHGPRFPHRRDDRVEIQPYPRYDYSTSGTIRSGYFSNRK